MGWGGRGQPRLCHSAGDLCPVPASPPLPPDLSLPPHPGPTGQPLLCSDLLVARVSPSTMPLLQEPFCSFTTCEGAAWAGLVSSRWCGGGSGAIPPRRWGSCPPSPGSGGRPELYSSRVSETPLLAPTLAFLFEGIAANRWDLLFCCCCCFWPHQGMWNLSSPTRDQTHAPCIGSLES